MKGIETWDKPGRVAHAFNPSTREAEAGIFLSWRPAWSTQWVPGQPRLHRKTLSRKKTKTKQNKKPRQRGAWFRDSRHKDIEMGIDKMNFWAWGHIKELTQIHHEQDYPNLSWTILIHWTPFLTEVYHNYKYDWRIDWCRPITFCQLVILGTTEQTDFEICFTTYSKHQVIKNNLAG